MKRLLPAALLYCLVTVLLTYPMVLQLGSAFPHDPGDPALNTWILWWNARTVPFTSTWWNAPAFYPLPGALSFSENLLGLSVIASPIQWLGGTPLLAYNVVFLLTFPLCALGAYLLALELTKRHDAAFIAGMLFGFAPYRMAHLPHIQVLAAFGMPVALLGLHRYLRDPRPRWLVLFGAAWLLQALSNGYYLLFFSALIGMWMLWFVRPPTESKALQAILAAGCIAALPLVPLLWRYKTIHERLGLVWDFGTIWQYGADVLALVSAEPALAFWGWLGPFRRAEGEIFPGLTLVLLLAAGTWMVLRGGTALRSDEARKDRKWRIARRVLMALSIGGIGLVGLGALMKSRSVAEPAKPLTWALGLAILLLITSAHVSRAYSRRSVLGFYVVAAFVMWLFSLGPAPTFMGEALMDRGPYALLMNLPGFDSLRVPARFWMISVLCLSVAGAIIFDRLGSRFGTLRLQLAGLIVVGVLGDAWLSNFLVVPVPDGWKPQACAPPPGEGAVLELPLGDSDLDVGAMYRSISHGRPTVNGYSGYFPPHYGMLRFGLALRDRDVLTQLAAHGLEYVVVDRSHRQERAWRRYVAGVEGAEMVCTGQALALFRLARRPGRPAAGRPLPIASLYANVNGGVVGLALDRDLSTRWTTGPQAEGMMFEIDLGTSRPLGAVELALGPSDRDYPRGLSIEASDDREAWRQVWRGTSGGRAVIAALVDPVVRPLTYDLSSVDARYLRLSLTAEDRTFYWSIAELKVLGR